MKDLCTGSAPVCVIVHVLCLSGTARRCPHRFSSCLLSAAAQEYVKLSDVCKMYGGSGGHREKPGSHGHSCAVDAVLAGACEVPSLPVLTLSLCSPVCRSLPVPCHVAPSAGWSKRCCCCSSGTFSFGPRHACLDW